MEETLEQTISVQTNAQGTFSEHIIPKSDGEYRITARYTGKNGKTFVSSQTVYVDAENAYIRNTDNNTVTDLIGDAHRVKVGETQ